MNRNATHPALELERVRMSRHISLEEISESTKISKHFLRAIEEEEFEKLPGGVFNVNYLRQYAAAIGFEPARLLALYHAKMGCNKPEPHDEAKRARWVFGWL